jgi:predicted DNA-binding antitoxin AbrB/MazE fold protein
MMRELEAIFVGGVLRPLEPLSLVENRRVRVTITAAPAAREVPYNDRRAEQAWIAAHGDECPGQWLRWTEIPF